MPAFSTKTIQKYSGIYFNTPSNWAKKNLYYLETYGHFVCDDKYSVSRAPFNSFLLMLTLKGSGTIITDTVQGECKKDDIVLLDCNLPHSYFANGEWEFLWFHFNGNNSKDMVKYITDQCSIIVHTDETSLSNYHFKLLAHNPFEKSISNEIIISSYISEILAQIVSVACTKKQDMQNVRLVNRAIDYIEIHYKDALTNAEIAKQLGVSSSAFCHIFKEETGFSPYDFILTKRINQAQQLLKTTDKSVSEIGYMVGFQSESNFIKVFRLKTNMTPGVFRTTYLY